MVYPELRRIAKAYFARERAGHTLQPTALVNEALLRFVRPATACDSNRTQFFALAAQMMRRILVDHARAVNADKRGGGAIETCRSTRRGGPITTGEFIALHEALEQLAHAQPPSGAHHRAAVLRRAWRRRNGRGARHLDSHGQPRSENGGGLARHGDADRSALTAMARVTPERLASSSTRSSTWRRSDRPSRPRGRRELANGDDPLLGGSSPAAAHDDDRGRPRRRRDRRGCRTRASRRRAGSIGRRSDPTA